MTPIDVFTKILCARREYRKKNNKFPEFLIISNNLYLKLYKYLMDNYSLFEFKEEDIPTDATIDGMKIKLISDYDILIVGCNLMEGEDVKD